MESCLSPLFNSSSTLSRNSSQEPRSRSLVQDITSSLLSHGAFDKSREDQLRRRKYGFILAWLLDVSSNDMQDHIYDVVEAMGLNDVVFADLSSVRMRRRLSENDKASICIPEFIGSLNAPGDTNDSPVLVQAFVKGIPCCFTNHSCAASFVSAREAEAIHSSEDSTPDSVMKSLLCPRDHPAFLRAISNLLVKDSSLESEIALAVQMWHRQTRLFVPCFLQVRVSFAPDGNQVVFGMKFTPEPSKKTPEQEGRFGDFGRVDSAHSAQSVPDQRSMSSDSSTSLAELTHERPDRPPPPPPAPPAPSSRARPPKPRRRSSMPSNASVEKDGEVQDVAASIRERIVREKQQQAQEVEKRDSRAEETCEASVKSSKPPSLLTVEVPASPQKLRPPPRSPMRPNGQRGFGSSR